MLPNLGTDNLLHVLTYLSIKDILSVRCVCTSLRDITKLRSVWYDVLNRETLEKDLPIAASSAVSRNDREFEGVGDPSSREGLAWDGGDSNRISDLSAAQLEDLTRGSVLLHNNWEDGTPVRKYCFNIPPDRSTLDYTMLHFINARIISSDRLNNPPNGPSSEESHIHEQEEAPSSLLRHRYLMTSSIAGWNGGHATFTVWDLTKLAAIHQDSVGQGHVWERACVATWRCSEAYQRHAVNKDEYSPGMIAIVLESQLVPSLQVLTFETFNDGPDSLPRFRVIKDSVLPPLLTRRLRILAFHGSRMVLSYMSPIQQLVIYDWVLDKAVYQLECFEVGDEVMGIHMAHDYTLVFRDQSICVYHTPLEAPDSRVEVDESNPNVLLKPSRPVSIEKWPWSLHSIYLSERDFPTAFSSLRRTSSENMRSGDTRKSKVYKPISVIVRFSSWYPWPVNVVHHFLLYVDPFFEEKGLASPYIFPLINQSLFTTALRLFGKTHLAISKYGSAVWLDSEAEEETSQERGSEYANTSLESTDGAPGMGEGEGSGEGSGGAQLDRRGVQQATRILGVPGVPSEQGQRLAGRRLPFAKNPLNDTFSIEATALHNNGSSTLYRRVYDMEEQTRRQNATATYYARLPDEEWWYVALDEEVGRIAIGERGSRVHIYEFI